MTNQLPATVLVSVAGATVDYPIGSTIPQEMIWAGGSVSFAVSYMAPII